MEHAMLYWLAENKQWREDLALAAANPNFEFSKFVALANSRQDFLQTTRLDRVVRKLQSGPPEGLGTKPVRLGLLGSATVDHLIPGLRIGGMRRKLWVDVHNGDYGQYRQELENPASSLHQFQPNTILFSLQPDIFLTAARESMSAGDADRVVEDALDQLRRLWQSAIKLCQGQVIQQTFLPVGLPLLGNNEHRLPGSASRLVERLNARIRDVADQEGVDLLALDTQIAQDGLRTWHDPVLWHHAKQDISPAITPLYGDLVGRLLAARQGRSAKCLVLDLDNTLWGGVIGDDGLAGIKLGQGSGIGEAYIAFQHYVKALSQRGIILAVCSKNDHSNAILPFEKHPEMVLKLSDIACFIANWEDKPANIRSIAERLNIGIDSLVFADDNPFERTIVRRELPLVAVPELPIDPTFYAQCIADAGYFEAVSLTSDDLSRAEQYQTNLKRESLRGASTDLTAYLRSLEMRLIWGAIDAISLTRVTQLINKTNQFNLTTRRYTEPEISEVMNDARSLTLQMRLTDQLGDNGIIAVVIAKPQEDAPSTYRIDTWLMSCRVLGRQVEEATLNLVAARAKALGAEILIGEFRPTGRNGMVADHYAKLGFSQSADLADGSTVWQLDLANHKPVDTFIEIVETP